MKIWQKILNFFPVEIQSVKTTPQIMQIFWNNPGQNLIISLVEKRWLWLLRKSSNRMMVSCSKATQMRHSASRYLALHLTRLKCSDTHQHQRRSLDNWTQKKKWNFCSNLEVNLEILIQILTYLAKSVTCSAAADMTSQHGNLREHLVASHRVILVASKLTYSQTQTSSASCRATQTHLINSLTTIILSDRL